uniref:N-terminal EF-hand calcium binding protein 1 n=1 Tax=Ficedula albicollis TaxID=59894 RepID=U3JRV1_FICAL
PKKSYEVLGYKSNVYASCKSSIHLYKLLVKYNLINDGKLSFDEFKAYFADGVLSGEELHDLFCTIDTHNTKSFVGNMGFCLLLDYFSKHLGEYENVLCVLEDLNITILKAMDKTKKDYQEASNLEQFVTCFLLRETLNQLQSLQSCLECAMETTEEQTRRRDPTKPEVLSVQWQGKRLARRLQRNNSLSSNNSYSTWIEEDSQWVIQINRLQKLIDRLEKKDLKLEPLEEEVLEENARSHIMIVQHQMSVIEEKVEEFRLALRQYVESASGQGGCLQVFIFKSSDNLQYMITMITHLLSLLIDHLQRNYSKAFQRSNVDLLETPELITTIINNVICEW